jgi:hypothetical protein
LKSIRVNPKLILNVITPKVMNIAIDHLNTALRTSTNARNHFEKKGQDDLTRFVYCGVQKISKLSLGLVRLYPQLTEENDEIEFSLGILIRSTLMDMILMMGARSIYQEYTSANHEEIKARLKDFALSVISDGTSHLIEEIYRSDQLTSEQKKEMSEKFAKMFGNVFDLSGEKPVRRKRFRFNLSDIYGNKHDSDLTADAVYNLYSYYSKYDHLSHWTSLSQQFPYEQRKGKLDLSIFLMTWHLRDILCIAYDFCDDYKSLLSYIEELNTQMQKGTESAD